jgi:Protein of unknown function (DUF3723)
MANRLVQDAATEQDEFLHATRISNYQGTACVRFKILRFEDTSELDPAKIQRINQIFATRGCLRLDPRHRISSLIERADLQRACETSGVAIAELKRAGSAGFVHLTFPEGYRLACLNGRHRVRAAESFLGPRDHWWAVDLFLSGTETRSGKNWKR